MSKIFKKALPVLGSIFGTLIAPGIGTAFGSTLGSATLGTIGGALGGAAGGAASGGGLKGAALGALGGAAFGAAPALSSASGLTSTAAQAGLTGGIRGAALGGLSGGGLKGVALGAGLGGLGGYIGAGGGVPGLGNLQGASLDQVTGVTGAQGPTLGSGVLGKLSGLTNVTAAGGAQPLKLGSLLSKGGDVLGYFQGQDDIDDIQNMLAQQSQLARNQFAPYSQAGQQALQRLQAPDLEALQNDPGYQFRLQQGNQALERSLAAQGLGNSGLALKAAQEYGQGLADQTYNDFYNRQMGLVNQGFGAASGLGSLYTNLGNAQAAAELARINQRNDLYSTLGGLFG